MAMRPPPRGTFLRARYPAVSSSLMALPIVTSPSGKRTLSALIVTVAPSGND
ncbi:hypothetical protein [Streptomyces tsukubensis]|uniref:hypothetical protein n=1 Tax=Streptomyces tsukubensis TaxID=83656 RepID=UPI0018726EE2|nr:hypothetical protein [Streptomyces tsukubensis]